MGKLTSLKTVRQKKFFVDNYFSSLKLITGEKNSSSEVRRIRGRSNLEISWSLKQELATYEGTTLYVLTSSVSKLVDCFFGNPIPTFEHGGKRLGR